MKNYIAYFLLAFMFFNHANAQLPLNDTKYRMLYMFDKDVNTYANGYLAPLCKGFGYGLQSGWYSTAKTHKLLGIDLSVGINYVFVPKRDESFTLRNSDYNNLRLDSGSEAAVPTLFGSKNSVTNIQIYDNVPSYGDAVLAKITAPEGIGLRQELGFSAVPVPVLQLGIGLIKNTDIKIRYIPDVLKDQDYSYWGIGLMHDIGQWIPVIAKLPIDISVFGSYSSLTFDAPLSNTGFNGTDQMVKAQIKGYSVEALVSKKLSVLTVLGGIGYVSSKTSFDLKGSYNITYPNAPTDLPEGYPTSRSLTDPIGINTKEGRLKLIGGLQLQLAIFRIFANYNLTFNKGYNVLSTGIGLSFR